MNSILTYLFWGVINTFLIESILDYVDKKVGLDTNFEFNLFHRIIFILFWPIYSFVFWYNFFKGSE